MNRRSFLKSVAIGGMATGIAGQVLAAEKFFPVQVDRGLFENINKVKDPAHKTHLETVHAPVISAPQTVKAGEPFTVTVSVGETLHPMGPAHWIGFISLEIGNQPAGRIDFQPAGYLSPKATFTVTLTKDSAPSGKATLVAHQRCNLHGYWESSLNISVA